MKITGFLFFPLAGGKAFGQLKEQQRQKLEEINQVRELLSSLSPSARLTAHWGI